MNIREFLENIGFKHKTFEIQLVGTYELYYYLSKDTNINIYVEINENGLKDFGICDYEYIQYGIGNYKSCYKENINDSESLLKEIIDLIYNIGEERGKKIRSEEFRKLLEIKD